MNRGNSPSSSPKHRNVQGDSPRNTSKRFPGAQVDDLERKHRYNSNSQNQKMTRKDGSAQREKDLFLSPKAVQKGKKLGDKFRQNNAVFELPDEDCEKFFNAKM